MVIALAHGSFFIYGPVALATKRGQREAGPNLFRSFGETLPRSPEHVAHHLCARIASVIQTRQVESVFQRPQQREVIVEHVATQTRSSAALIHPQNFSACKLPGTAVARAMTLPDSRKFYFPDSYNAMSCAQGAPTILFRRRRGLHPLPASLACADGPANRLDQLSGIVPDSVFEYGHHVLDVFDFP